MDEILERIKEDEGVKLIHSIIDNAPTTITRELRVRNVNLAGGAVVDIAEGRKPKDYDITGVNNSKLIIKLFRDAGFKFHDDSRTATTYKRNGLALQFLKLSWPNFEFTISQSRYNLRTSELTIDEDAFNNKLLIPTGYSTSNSKNCLLRLPHWKAKGYDLTDITYYSLVNSLAGKQVTSTDIYSDGTWSS